MQVFWRMVLFNHNVHRSRKKNCPPRSGRALSLATRFPPGAQAVATETAVGRALEAQQVAWNRGDVEAFMSGYQEGNPLPS